MQIFNKGIFGEYYKTNNTVSFFFLNLVSRFLLFYITLFHYIMTVGNSKFSKTISLFFFVFHKFKLLSNFFFF
jgi:hypothetical protein